MSSSSSTHWKTPSGILQTQVKRALPSTHSLEAQLRHHLVNLLVEQLHIHVHDLLGVGEGGRQQAVGWKRVKNPKTLTGIKQLHLKGWKIGCEAEKEKPWKKES